MVQGKLGATEANMRAVKHNLGSLQKDVLNFARNRDGTSDLLV